MYKVFRLIVKFEGRSDCMRTDFRKFLDGFDILTHYKQTFHLFTLVLFDQK